MVKKKQIIISLALILFIGIISAYVPLSHAFHGTVSYQNGSLVNTGKILAKIHGLVVEEGDIINGTFGYGYNFIVEQSHGDWIDIYVQGYNNSVGRWWLTPGEVTNLDIILPSEGFCNNSHNISIRYSYSNSFGTGIAVKQNESWMNTTPVVLNEGNYEIKYYIDNNAEDDDNVNISVKLDNQSVSEYTQLINNYHYKTISLNTTECGMHVLSLKIKSDGEECNIEDNFAERQIYVQCAIPFVPVCGNYVVETGEQCDDGNIINGDGCSSSCLIEIPPTPINNTENESCEVKLRNSNSFVQFCDVDWKCSDWSECNNGKQTRTCVDTSNCNVKYNNPIEELPCMENAMIERDNKEIAEGLNGNMWKLIFGIIVFLFLFLILVFLMTRK